MYQRKEKTERHGSQEDVLALVSLLDSQNSDIVKSVEDIINENLSSSKDSKLLCGLVDYFIAVQSDCSFDILLRVKDPHDKHLFDKINDLMKSEESRYQSLQLLCKLVYKSPSWLHKIAHHRVMKTLFNVLETDFNPTNLISALFIIVCLLPMIPSQIGHYLPEIFDVFSRLVAWNCKKPSTLTETYVMHLQIGVYSLFHRLYGMFPCNFLAYLRSYYGGRDYSAENFKIFASCIKPMLERVRLHPLLVTASKETELSPNRWKKMAHHDIIVDCAAISLDPVEGTLESLKSKSDYNVLQNAHYSQDSMQYVSMSSQSSTISANLESGCSMTDAVFANREVMWSPSFACGVSTPPSASHVSPLSLSKNESELKYQLSVEENIPLDYAIEAKPESLLPEENKLWDEKLKSSHSKDLKSMDSEPVASHENSESLKLLENPISTRVEKDAISQSMGDVNIFEAAEAKEEDIDKEVSELTSTKNDDLNLSPVEVRHDTPFCSTTQNLTDEPSILNHKPSVSSSGHSDSLTKSNEDDTDEMYNSMQENDADTFIPAFSRFRYFSHCGPSPDIPQENTKKSNLVRSSSCPSNIFLTSSDFELNNISNQNQTEDSVDNYANTVTTSSGFPVLSNSSNNTRTMNYEQLIPVAVAPFQHFSTRGSEYQYGSLFSSLSPPELLDSFMRMSNIAYLTQLNKIPIPSMRNTNWTHFDGKPPADEVAILRNEVLLLYNQVLFERHRKDIHSERNRRILGRAKKLRMLQENIDALKGQINLLEKDNQDLKNENAILTNLYHKLQNEKEQFVTELKNNTLKICREKDQLMLTIEKLQSLTNSQKQENDQLCILWKKCQSDALHLQAEIELSQSEMDQCESIRKDAVYMSKQLILLQELNSHYKDKLDLLKEQPQIDIGLDLWKEAESVEINDLKQKLEIKTNLLDATKCKVADLESVLINLKSKQKEQSQVIEHLKSLHRNDIEVREERLVDLRKISIQKDVHILELYKDNEVLKQRSMNLEKTQNSIPNSASNSMSVHPCTELL